MDRVPEIGGATREPIDTARCFMFKLFAIGPGRVKRMAGRGVGLGQNGAWAEMKA
jgi:hypothetical protein